MQLEKLFNLRILRIFLSGLPCFCALAIEKHRGKIEIFWLFMSFCVL
jgi:hypothetical protein